MKLAKIEEMSTEELVERFAAICASQDDALLRSQIAKFKLLYNEMAAVEDELKSRPGDQRRAFFRALQSSKLSSPIAIGRSDPCCRTRHCASADWEQLPVHANIRRRATPACC